MCVPVCRIYPSGLSTMLCLCLCVCVSVLVCLLPVRHCRGRINSCVGQANHRSFLLLLVLFLSTSVYGISLVLQSVCPTQPLLTALLYCPGVYDQYRYWKHWHKHARTHKWCYYLFNLGQVRKMGYSPKCQTIPLHVNIDFDLNCPSIVERTATIIVCLLVKMTIGWEM